MLFPNNISFARFCRGLNFSIAFGNDVICEVTCLISGNFFMYSGRP